MSNIELENAVQDALANIEHSIISYLDGRIETYRTIATNLRALLLDRNAVQSYLGRGAVVNNLFEAVYGVDTVCLQSFLDENGEIRGDILDKDSVAVGPPLYVGADYVLVSAKKVEDMIPLGGWLQECSVRDFDGTLRTTGEVIHSIANTEGAHFIEARKRRINTQTGIGLSRPNAPYPVPREELDFHPWYQYIVEAGAKLILARTVGDMQPVLTSHLQQVATATEYRGYMTMMLVSPDNIPVKEPFATMTPMITDDTP